MSTATITAGESSYYPPQTTLRALPNQDWTNYRWGGVGYDMTDYGLGLKSASVTRAGDDALASAIVNLTCNGVDIPCAYAHNTNGFPASQLPFDLEPLGEGDHTLRVRAQDVVNNVTHSTSWHARYDTSAPSLDPLSGTLYAKAGQTIPSTPAAVGQRESAACRVDVAAPREASYRSPEKDGHRTSVRGAACGRADRDAFS